MAKRVRTETQIGTASVSIASVAVDLAKKIFGSLEGKTVLLVGAGKMSELAARHLMQQGADSMLIANRTYDRAVQLAQTFSGQAVRFEDLHARARPGGHPYYVDRERRSPSSAASMRSNSCTGGESARCFSSILRCRAMWTRR